MPEPIEYQIVLNLQQALQAIAVATDSRYYYDLSDAAVKLDANADVEALIGMTAIRPFVVLDVQPETRSYSMQGRVEITTPVLIHWITDVGEMTDEARVRTFFRGCADVERAITKDISRGGLAIDTLVIDRTLDKTTDGARVWATVRTEIHNRRVYAQP